ncbi:MAG: hypothetical protein AAF487_00525 [Bacteroidota bacterium]
MNLFHSYQSNKISEDAEAIDQGIDLANESEKNDQYLDQVIKNLSELGYFNYTNTRDLQEAKRKTGII